MKPGFLAMSSLVALLIAGCSWTHSNRETGRVGRSFFGSRGAPEQNEEPDQKPETDWDYVGKQARGDEPRERDSDPLAKWIEHPTSREIKRNLRMDD
jgi:hypothetical protein